ncbi:stage III sporulation protein AH [Bacillus cereus]|uniref:stage III sporulation protein AH n=1 Tax=Bacillus TaxID=1386 RepID=UPI0009B4A750|nr:MULTISPECIES: stage III sporulation protein AH [Bacillus cereus group]NIE92738.1 stage III sporulation protein AH [Bacillus sp. Ab-1751]PGV38786.1 stage III sporulation protein AH [Bacillus anthracis]MCU7754381.1 stage III sporulation protein AH [Bacillus cereus]MDA2624427.1 stage III sporulation protein AH [Bacillus cereus]MDC7749168.1 stage III sporulation protein AH [Bacillus cereus]
MIIIDSNPKDQVYVDLLDLAFETCDTFHLVLRKDMGSLDSYDPILKKLELSLIKMRELSEWSSTILGDNQTAKVYFYHANTHAKKILKELSNSLYSWEQPDLPEDLSFFKKGEKWLVSCSHEQESFINTHDKNEIKKVFDIVGLKAHIGEL